MENSLLEDNELKNIIFDVLDGIPANEDESKEAFDFRKTIELDSKNMESIAEELGLKNIFVEFSSDI